MDSRLRGNDESVSVGGAMRGYDGERVCEGAMRGNDDERGCEKCQRLTRFYYTTHMSRTSARII